MQGEPRPSYTRRIVLVILAVCVGLVLLGALLPSPQQREMIGKRQKLVGLKKVSVPPLPSDPVFVLPWKEASYGGNVPGRSVTIHVYLRAGLRTSRADLLDQRYSGVSGVRSRTVFHIAFDPKRQDEVRLVAAIAATKSGMNLQLLRNGFMAGRTPTRLTFVLSSEAQAGRKRFSEALERVAAELNDGSATAHPAGTVLYEADGVCYVEPKIVGAGIGVSYSGPTTNAYEALEAMSDRRVDLP
ncbi:MAG: hypothetical protein EON58_22035 [Alphaproteobacteria bacterium]|nr:MAG: hypothetical protein EON58_22035 [Alphaproteobacteria bacterium]